MGYNKFQWWTETSVHNVNYCWFFNRVLAGYTGATVIFVLITSLIKMK